MVKKQTKFKVLTQGSRANAWSIHNIETERLTLDRVEYRQDEPIKIANLKSKLITGESEMHIPLKKTFYYDFDPLFTDIFYYVMISMRKKV